MLKNSMHAVSTLHKPGQGSLISVRFITVRQDASIIPPLITFLALLRPSQLSCVRAISSGKNGWLPQFSGVPLQCRTVLHVSAAPAQSLTDLSAD